MTVPTFLPYYVLAGSVGTISALLFGLNAALADASWAVAERRTTMRITAFVLIGWFAVAASLAWFGAYHGVSDRIPTIQYGIFIPILIGVFVAWRSPLVKRIIDAVPQSWIVAVQLYRALGVVFLILYALGNLPAPFALPAGLGDTLVGLSAPIIALAYARSPNSKSGVVRRWNILGLFDLLVALTMGFATSPSPLQVFSLDAPNELISAFPLVLIPVFLVPVSILLHFASMAKLNSPGKVEIAFSTP